MIKKSQKISNNLREKKNINFFNINLNFSDQFRYALADLIRDHTLNDKSKELDLDKHPEVIAEYDKWYDNYRAIAQRKEIIGKDSEFNSIKVSSALNEYFILVPDKVVFS